VNEASGAVGRPLGVPVLHEDPVPQRLPGALTRGPLVEATAEAVLIRVPMVGRFLVQGLGPTLVERAAGASDADLGCFRDGPVAAAAALLRGELPLRAASVSIDARAVLLCGPSAAGKSALAAALAQRGHPVLADAVTVISPELGGGRPTVTPVAPEPVVWPDTAAELDLVGTPARPVRPALASRAYRLGPEPSPAPVAAVVALRTNPAKPRASLDPVVGAARLRTLLALRWHSRLVDPLGLTDAQFAVLARMAADADCAHLVRPRRGAPATALAELVEGLMA
jgi:hypothetical protein